MTLVFNQATSGEPGTHALIIGAGDYESSLPPLSGTVASVHALATWLEDEYRNPTAPLASIELLLSASEPGRQLFRGASVERPTQYNLARATREWRRRADENAGSLTLFYYAGHGAQIANYSCMVLEPPDRDQDSPGLFVSIENIIAALAVTRADRQIFLIDTDRSTLPSANEAIALLPVTSSGSRFPRRAVFQSAAPGQHAYEVPEKGSTFITAFMESVRSAEPDGRGAITANALQTQLRERMIAIAEARGIAQVPQIELTGDFDFHYVGAAPAAAEAGGGETEEAAAKTEDATTGEPAGQGEGTDVPVGTPGPQGPAKEENTDFVSDDAEVERDELNRSVLAVGLARRLHRIWRRANATRRDGDASFVVHLDAPWGGGKTTFANYLARVLNPCPPGARPAQFLLKRYPGEDLGGIFLDDPPTKAEGARQLFNLPDDERRPWIIVNFNAWQHEHCAPPWWVFYQTIRHQCIRAIRKEGSHPWCSNPRRDPLDRFRRHASFLMLSIREIAWRLTSPKIRMLLGTAFLSGLILALMIGESVWGVAGEAGKQTAGFLLNKGAGLFLAGLTGFTALWGFGALVTESIVPGTDTLAERLSLGKSDPFQRFRRHFDHTMRAVRRPVLVVVDDLDRCQPGFVVDLVRGIQTILRSTRVVFLILGDRDWIERAFESHHASMASVDVGPEQTFGARFVEKAIQMSFILPAVGRDSQESYVRRVLLADRETASKTGEIVAGHIREIRKGISEAAAATPGAPALQPVVDATMAKIREQNPDLGAEETAATRQQVEQEAGATLAINAAVDERVEGEVIHELQRLAGAFPPNPRQIKRIVNAITIYWAVALQRWGDKIPPGLRFQLAIWVTIMTEWPQTWRTLIICPELAGCIAADKPLDALAKLAPGQLPGSPAASQAELERILADRQLVELMTGRGAQPHAPLTPQAITLLVELTPLRTRRWRLKEPESGSAKRAHAEPKRQSGRRDSGLAAPGSG